MIELEIVVDTRRLSTALRQASWAAHLHRLRWDVRYRLEMEHQAALADWESEGGTTR